MTSELDDALNARAHAIDEAIRACQDIDAETKLLGDRDALIIEARDAGYVRMFDGTFAKVATFNID